MAATGEALRIAPPSYDVGTGAHAPWNDSEISLSSPDGPLPGDQDIPAVMVLARDVIVVAVDRLLLDLEWRHLAAARHRPDDAPHQQPAIGDRELLRPLHRLDIFVEMLGAFREIREILVG